MTSSSTVRHRRDAAGDVSIVAVAGAAGLLDPLSALVEAVPPGARTAIVVVRPADADHDDALAGLLARRVGMAVREAADGATIEAGQIYTIPRGAIAGIDGATLRMHAAARDGGANLPVDHLFAGLAAARGTRAVGVVLSGDGVAGGDGLRAIRGAGGLAVVQDPEEAAVDAMPRNAIAAGSADLVLPAARMAEAIIGFLSRRETDPGSGRGHAFFRDPDALAGLSAHALPDLLRRVEPGGPLRLWVPAAGRGEEAYSLAMLLLEQGGFPEKTPAIQIFATDADERALAIGRTGIYPDTIEASVPTARLRQFFVHHAGSYRVIPDIRDSVVFAAHDLMSHPPFSRLSLLSCRGVLGSVQPEIRERLVRLFHFSLDVGGILFTGSAADSGLAGFETVSGSHGIYRKRDAARLQDVVFPVISGQPASPAPRSDLADRARAQILARFVPACAVVDRTRSALYFSGETDQYLRVPAGEASRDLLQMARDGLRPKLRLAIDQAFERSARVTIDGATVLHHGTAIPVTIEAEPFHGDREALVLVAFLPGTAIGSAAQPGAPGPDASHRILTETRQALEDTIHRLEATNAELVAANEAAASTSESLQAANEELETSQEELQALNEELATLNGELREKADQHRRNANDLRNLLVSADIATIFLDRDLNISRFTPAVEQLFGIREADQGRPLSDLAPRFDDPSLDDDARKALHDAEPVRREIRADDGAWLLRRVFPYRTESGRTDGVVITFVDITDQKAAQATLDGQRRMAQGVVDSVREWIVVLDGAFRIVFASRPFLAAFDATDRPVDGATIDSILGGLPEAARILAALRRVRDDTAAEEDLDIPFRLPGTGPVDSPSGAVARIRARQIVGGPGDAPLFLLTMEDVTAERSAQKALRESERQLREKLEELESLYDTSPIGLVLLDREMRYLRINEALAGFNGIPAAAHLGRAIREVLPAAVADQAEPLIRRVIETGEPLVGGEIRGETSRAPGVEHRWIEDFYPLRAADGTVRAVGGIVREVTESRRAEEAQRQAKEEAERTNRAKSDFLAAASHDLRQPLQTVGMIQEVLARRIADAELQPLIANLGARVATMTETLNTLLDIDQLESGAIEPQPGETEVDGLLSRIVDELSATAEAKGLGLDYVPSSLLVRSDPRLMVRILQNLVSNAVKYTSTGRVVVGCRRRGDTVRIEVWDTGSGIPKERLPLIFNRYVRVGHDTVRDQRGRGLGLSVVRRMADLLGHDLDVRSVPGKGSMFAVVAPKITSRRPVRPRFRTGVTGGPARVLLVVDDPLLRTTLSTLLELDGHAVISGSADTAGEGAWTAPVPDVVIAAAHLEGRSGIEAVHAIRSACGRPGLPAIVLSSTGRRQDLMAIDAAGMRHASEPFKGATLSRLIEEATGLSPARPNGGASGTEATDVHVVEDDPAVAQAMCRTLEEAGMRVTVFDSAEAFLDAFRPGQGRCVVVDVGLPGINGLELLDRLGGPRAPLRVVIATGRRDLRVATQAVRAGAAEVLEKPIRRKMLVETVRRALESRETGRDSQPDAEAQKRYGQLTDRERQVLALVVAGHANKEVAYRLTISERTVEGHRARVMRKMGARSLADLVRACADLRLEVVPAPRHAGAH